MRDQYKVLAEKYNQVTESLFSKAEQDYNTNPVVKEIKAIAKKYAEVFYNANSVEELVETEKEKAQIIEKYRARLVPLKGSSSDTAGSALDLFYELVEKNIEELTGSKLTIGKTYLGAPRNKEETTKTPADYLLKVMQKCIFYILADERGYVGNKIAAPYLRDADKIFEQSIMDWKKIKQSAATLRKGSEEAGVNLDI